MSATSTSAPPVMRAAGSSRHRRALAVILPIGIGVAAALVAWFRLTPAVRGTFWAEDGRTFVGAAATLPQLATLLQPYAGYLHFVPRLEAIVTVDLVPVQWWAESMTALSCLLAGIVAAIVFASTRELLPWLPARIAVAGLTVLTPLATREVLGNAANLHSILFWGLFWVLLSRPRRLSASWILAGFALIAALTEVQSLFLVPLLLWCRHERGSWPMKAALLVGVAAQVFATVTSPRHSNGQAPDSPLSLLVGWLINAVSTSWIPVNRVDQVLGAVGLWPVVLLALVPLAAVAVTLSLGSARQRAVSLLLLGTSLLVWCAGVLIDPQTWYDYANETPAELAHAWLSRYGVVPAMMLLAELALAAAVLAARRERWSSRLAVAVLLSLAVTTVSQAPTNISRRAAGYAWQPQIAAAVRTCTPPHVAEVALKETIGWEVIVPCRDFDAFTG